MDTAPRTEPVTIQTAAITLSGLCCRPSDAAPRGLIVALHGGGYSAGYWDCRLAEGLSLLALGARLGFTVLALDRPGYGAAQGHEPSQLGLSSQVDLLFGAIEAWRAHEGFEGPVFVAGHSIGGVIALLMAADARGGRLGGVDVLGAPLRYPRTRDGEQVAARPVIGDHVPAVDSPDRTRLVFGPAGTHDREVYAYEASCRRPMPAAEYRDALRIPDAWQELLPAIRIPVQFNLAEFEAMQVTGWDALNEVRAMLTGSINAAVHLQRHTGHDASLHHVARAYHLRMIAFFEESLAVQRQAARGAPVHQSDRQGS